MKTIINKPQPKHNPDPNSEFPRVGVGWFGLILETVIWSVFFYYAYTKAPVLACFPGAILLWHLLLSVMAHIERTRRQKRGFYFDPDGKSPLTTTEAFIFAVLTVLIVPFTLILAFGWDATAKMFSDAYLK